MIIIHHYLIFKIDQHMLPEQFGDFCPLMERLHPPEIEAKRVHLLMCFL